MSKQQSPETKTILTPTARLARAVKRRLSDARLSGGAQAWRAPEVLSFSAWLGKLRMDALIAGAVDRVPVSASQARMLWQQVIDTDVFVGAGERGHPPPIPHLRSPGVLAYRGLCARIVAYRLDCCVYW